MISDEDEEEVDPDAMEEDKAPRLDSELREFTPDEISELDVKVLKAKIATLEGTSHHFRRSCVDSDGIAESHRANW
jgi:hypothetical protein